MRRWRYEMLLPFCYQSVTNSAAAIGTISRSSCELRYRACHVNHYLTIVPWRREIELHGYRETRPKRAIGNYVLFTITRWRAAERLPLFRRIVL